MIKEAIQRLKQKKKQKTSCSKRYCHIYFKDYGENYDHSVLSIFVPLSQSEKVKRIIFDVRKENFQVRFSTGWDDSFVRYNFLNKINTYKKFKNYESDL